MSVQQKRIFIIITALLFFIQHTIYAGEGEQGGDTVIIACGDNIAAISKNSRCIQTAIEKKSDPQTKTNSRYVLRFENMEMKEAPDGAYEVYISTRKKDKKNLAAVSPDFVSVINTFSLNSEPPVKTIYLDITKNMEKIAVTQYRVLYISILFRGNRLSNKKESTHAGMLYTQRICLLQVTP